MSYFIIMLVFVFVCVFKNLLKVLIELAQYLVTAPEPQSAQCKGNNHCLHQASPRSGGYNLTRLGALSLGQFFLHQLDHKAQSIKQYAYLERK